jgi:predicted RNA-binding Zn-ribbon protein involved in translation (DUF1610 family)
MAAPKEHRWPCEQCGAQLRYAPGQTELVCDHCGHVQAIPATAGRSRDAALIEHDLHRALADNLPGAAMEEVRTTTCTNCGAQIEFQGASHATECPFCASPVVVDTGAQRLIKPQALVPFALDERQAREAMVKWMGNLWFAPNTLMEYARKGRAMNGVYVPYWTFDADTSSTYTGQRGVYYYVTRTVTVQENGRSVQKQVQERKTRWYPASGRVSRDFNDVLVLGSTGLPRGLATSLGPWTLDALAPYAPDYLAGFNAEGYTVPLDAAHAEAQQEMSYVIRQDVERDIGGDEQRVDSVDTTWSEETFKHVLLPVWLAAYKYNGKSYRFLVNGQTGKVRGERPWSVWKITFAVVVVAALALAAVYIANPEALGLSRPDWLD